MPSPAPDHPPPPSSEPSLFYRATARLNVVVWRLPLPRRVLVRLSNAVYRNPPMPGDTVVGLLACMRAAGVRCWITGGWGVDALARRRSRTHRDLDLAVDAQDTERALAVLRGAGYREWYRSDSDALLESSIVMCDHELSGRAVDVHPVELPNPEIDFTVGAIDGQPVPCTSVAWQRRAHTGYRRRRRDRADYALLMEL